MTTAPDPAEFVAALPRKMRTGRVTYFPIRHHSPACAAHLRRWIAANKPDEAPANDLHMTVWVFW